MTSTIRTLLLLTAAISSVGCAATRFNGAEQALSIEEEHPVSVDSQTVTMTLAAAGASDDLSELDSARLRAFADSYMRNGHGALTVTSPGDGGAAGICQSLYDFGVPQSAIAEAAYRGGDGRDIILSYTRYVATPSACGVWEGEGERNARNMRSPNFGCAAQNNLAAMIGDPHDLIEPAAMTDPDSATRIRGVTKFRKGEVTSSKTDSEVKTQVSDQ